MEFNNLQSVSGIEPLDDDTASQITGGEEDRSITHYVGNAVGYVAENAFDFAEGVYNGLTDDD